MSTIPRTLTNVWKSGLKNSWWQLWYMGDTKFGTLVGVDKFGNKYFENNEELPLRTRWIEYKKHDYDAGQVEPGWHAWISYLVDKPPTEDVLLQRKGGQWDDPKQNLTATRGAYKPYSTTRPKVTAWEPIAAERK